MTDAGKKERVSILCVGSPSITTLLGWRLQQSSVVTCQETIMFFNAPEPSTNVFTIQSKKFGTRKYRPTYRLSKLEEVTSDSEPFDYVFVSIKPNSRNFQLSNILEPVITAKHTCIVYNSTGAIGVEEALQRQYPENPIFSLITHTPVSQRSVDEFFFGDCAPFYLAPAGSNLEIDQLSRLVEILEGGEISSEILDTLLPLEIEDLALPLSLYPLTVLTQNPNLPKLLERPDINDLHQGILQELDSLCNCLGSSLDVKKLSKQRETLLSHMQVNPAFREYRSNRPVEIVQYLHYCIDLATKQSLQVPRLRTISALISSIQHLPLVQPHHMNDMHGPTDNSPKKNKVLVNMRPINPSSFVSDRHSPLHPYSVPENGKPNMGRIPSAPSLSKGRAMTADNMDMLSLTTRRSRRSLYSPSLMQMQQSLKSDYEGLGRTFDPRFAPRGSPPVRGGKNVLSPEAKEHTHKNISPESSRFGTPSDPNSSSQSLGNEVLSRPNSNSNSAESRNGETDDSGESETYFTLMNNNKGVEPRASVASETSSMTVIPNAMRRFPLARGTSRMKS
ncbi:oxidoreductase [Schizosaccharomyces pombe]|uniref:Uncharacterized protein C24B11.07c n=1 Tax=Schizosaccharomyces pombe (strain 972 / ATCC 24843) TaxID=284812 RepID=YAI7_SCHPO|nr:putative oxidoreductase [Schizosaccharomyces pombe]Q09894.1 RecName: Full=Uncharacterized protein C24B11.07c [Schizosaccharomyces pombe 972h-]CAA91772.1 oxidoreductase (predicted) [Schizosaccharomyces pombe]|eukprot:NP_592844.1 putative oxidoreductase [Schizosaccharomyces pombe]